MAIDTNTPALPEEVPQEELVILESSVAEEQLNTEHFSTNESLLTISDSTVPISENVGLNNIAKTFYWSLWVTVLWASIFFGINYYENINYCSFEMNEWFLVNWEMNPFLCKEGPEIFVPERTPCKNPWGLCFESKKPLILLYPETEQEVSVELEYTPGFSATFPEYDNSKKGWSITASPDGTLLDHTTKQETYWLFWEGNSTDSEFDLSKGWIVASRDLRNFFYEKLTEIGLNTKEKSDFIMYWYPKLQEYPYVQITFAGEDYNQSAPLKITPKPDSLLRVFMVAKPLDTPKAVEPQKLEKFERKGFSVVEWGGTIITAH